MNMEYPSTGDTVKSLYAAPTKEQLDALEWARDFMNRYERKQHG